MHFCLEECTVSYSTADWLDTSILHYGRSRCGPIGVEFTVHLLIIHQVFYIGMSMIRWIWRLRFCAISISMHFCLEECTVSYGTADWLDTSILHFGRSRCGPIGEEFTVHLLITLAISVIAAFSRYSTFMSTNFPFVSRLYSFPGSANRDVVFSLFHEK